MRFPPARPPTSATVEPRREGARFSLYGRRSRLATAKFQIVPVTWRDDRIVSPCKDIQREWSGVRVRCPNEDVGARNSRGHCNAISAGLGPLRRDEKQIQRYNHQDFPAALQTNSGGQKGIVCACRYPFCMRIACKETRGSGSNVSPSEAGSKPVLIRCE